MGAPGGGGKGQGGSAVATAVVAGSKVACDLAMPEPPEGKKANLDQVSVQVVPSPGAPAQKIPHVSDAARCGSGGWYYDSAIAPTKIILCPTTCTWAQGLTQAKPSLPRLPGEHRLIQRTATAASAAASSSLAAAEGPPLGQGLRRQEALDAARPGFLPLPSRHAPCRAA